MEVIINGIRYVPEKSKDTKKLYTIVDILEPHIGTKEYEGIVADIQEWYYGSVAKYPWCATCISYALAQLGLLKYTLTRKQENVYFMNEALKNTGTAKVIDIKDIKTGDIIILNFSGRFSATSNKHVTCAYENYSGSQTLACIGGNQDNSICVKNYNITDIVAVYRPDYSKGTK